MYTYIYVYIYTHTRTHTHTHTRTHAHTHTHTGEIQAVVCANGDDYCDECDGGAGVYSRLDALPPRQQQQGLCEPARRWLPLEDSLSLSPSLSLSLTHSLLSLCPSVCLSVSSLFLVFSLSLSLLRARSLSLSRARSLSPLGQYGFFLASHNTHALKEAVTVTRYCLFKSVCLTYHTRS